MQFQHAEAPRWSRPWPARKKSLEARLRSCRSSLCATSRRSAATSLARAVPARNKALPRAAGLSFPPGSPTPRPVLPLAAFKLNRRQTGADAFRHAVARRHRVHCLVKERVPMAVGLGPRPPCTGPRFRNSASLPPASSDRGAKTWWSCAAPKAPAWPGVHPERVLSRAGDPGQAAFPR